VTGPTRVAHLVAALALSYPDEQTLGPLARLGPATAALPPRLADPLGRVLRHLGGASPAALAADYVATFDLRRRCCLYLTYYTHGDTRRRGPALVRFHEAYRAAGYEADEAELPDHLAVVLAFSALGAHDAAVELLRAHRPGLDLLWHALDGLGSPYADAVVAVLASLPRPGPGDLAAARRLAADGPPTELVGIS
jgi:nitrate reductase delta subunit